MNSLIIKIKNNAEKSKNLSWCYKCLLMVLTVSTTVSISNAQSWVNVGGTNFSAGVVNFTSMAIDGSGTPYVVYQDQANSNKATVMKFNGSSWVTVGSAGFSDSSAYSTSIAIDTGGTPYVVYMDYGHGYKATVKKFNGSSWITVGNSGFSDSDALYTTITIDKNGTPYVVYQDYSADDSYSDAATVMKFNGSIWSIVGTAGFTIGEANYTSISIDTGGTPYVAYEDGYLGPASVMKFNGSSWIPVRGTWLSSSYVHS